MATALRKVVESSPAATSEPVRVAAQAVQPPAPGLGGPGGRQ